MKKFMRTPITLNSCVTIETSCARGETEEKKMKLLEEKHQFEQENKYLEIALEASRKHASEIEKKKSSITERPYFGFRTK